MIVARVLRYEDPRREWFELLETEDELMALADSVASNHPDGYLVDAIELQENAP